MCVTRIALPTDLKIFPLLIQIVLSMRAGRKCQWCRSLQRHRQDKPKAYRIEAGITLHAITCILGNLRQWRLMTSNDPLPLRNHAMLVYCREIVKETVSHGEERKQSDSGGKPGKRP
jgi:hypothetical protein